LLAVRVLSTASNLAGYTEAESAPLPLVGAYPIKIAHFARIRTLRKRSLHISRAQKMLAEPFFHLAQALL
jgi:hypothetical protein